MLRLRIAANRAACTRCPRALAILDFTLLACTCSSRSRPSSLRCVPLRTCRSFLAKHARRLRKPQERWLSTAWQNRMAIIFPSRYWYIAVRCKQLIVSFRRGFSTRILTLRAAIVRPSPAQAHNYRSVSGDPARSQPTYAYAAFRQIRSIVPAPTLIADSSIKENTTPYADPVLCASLILPEPTPRLAKALFLSSSVFSACLPLPHWLRSPPVAK